MLKLLPYIESTKSSAKWQRRYLVQSVRFSLDHFLAKINCRVIQKKLLFNVKSIGDVNPINGFFLKVPLLGFLIELINRR